MEIAIGGAVVLLIAGGVLARLRVSFGERMANAINDGGYRKTGQGYETSMISMLVVVSFVLSGGYLDEGAS